jgi:hypothetical protein
MAYQEKFLAGSKVRIADRGFLDNFLATWKYHHKLQPEQLLYADRVGIVTGAAMYHGGDQLYTLPGILGIWHEECLRPVG